MLSVLRPLWGNGWEKGKEEWAPVSIVILHIVAVCINRVRPQSGPKDAGRLRLTTHDDCAKTCEHDAGWCKMAERSLAT
jgi:hypothetical protein